MHVNDGLFGRNPLMLRRNSPTPDASALRAIVMIRSSHRKRQMRIDGALRRTIGFPPNGALYYRPRVGANRRQQQLEGIDGEHGRGAGGDAGEGWQGGALVEAGRG